MKSENFVEQTVIVIAAPSLYVHVKRGSFELEKAS